MGRLSSIVRLPDNVRAHITARLTDGRMTLDELIEDLRETFPEQANSGELPSRAAVHRYGKKLDETMGAVHASTQAAKLIRDQVGDREDARSEALIAMIQSSLFDCIMRVHSANDKDMADDKRIGILSVAAKNIATLTRSSVNLKKFQSEVEESVKAKLLAAQDANLKEAVRSQGMDEAQADFWRKKVLGIV